MFLKQTFRPQLFVKVQNKYVDLYVYCVLEVNSQAFYSIVFLRDVRCCSAFLELQAYTYD